MAKSARLKENNFKLSGENIRFIVYILLAVLCIALFLIFGRSGRTAPTSADASPSTAAAPTAEPKGVPMGKFVRALNESGMDCDIGEVRIIDGNEFTYPLTMPDCRDGAFLAVKTDSIGRVIECTLELGYMYAGEPDASFSDATASVIKAEYRRREKADTALVSAFIESIYALLADDCNISAIDGKKIADSIESAYYSGKSYDKKAGSARFYCETENAEDDEFNFTFRVIASFNY
ncbi:MAG: hypothetical protein IKZ82_07065 [Clostridia bacterium]|nr:hypothetical protein [Clostridia bacterium]